MKSLYPALVLIICMLRGDALIAQAGAPEWTRGITWYHIVTDRFHRDTDPPERSTDAGETVSMGHLSDWSANWYGPVDKEITLEEFFTGVLARRYGGTLRGIESKLDYLQSLGVGGLILAPVFSSATTDGFDIVAHHHIDARYGSARFEGENPSPPEKGDNPATWHLTTADRDFFALLRAAHGRGMKVIVEIQLEYAGAAHWAFQDARAHGLRSPYAGWFAQDRPATPDAHDSASPAFRGMWDIPSWPMFGNDSLRPPFPLFAYFKAAIRRWMNPGGTRNPVDGVDGWYIHQHGRYGAAFWRELTMFIKSVNPEAAVIGIDENSADESSGAGAERWFDACADRRFAQAATDFVVHRTATPTYLDKTLSDLRSDPDGVLVDGRLNMVDSPETARMASMAVNPAVPFHTGNPLRDGAAYLFRPPTSRERDIQRLLILLQFTLPGAPVVYYGDEAGMWGGDDPDNRKPMTWPDGRYAPAVTRALNGDTTRYAVAFDSAMYGYYVLLSRLRASHLCLRMGGMNTVALDDAGALYAYMRDAGADKVCIAVNLGNDARECRLHFPGAPDGLRVDDILHNLAFYIQKEYLTVIIPGKSGLVLVPAY